MEVNITRIKGWNNNKSWCEYKNLRKYHLCENNYSWNLSTCRWKNGEYIASITVDSVITCY